MEVITTAITAAITENTTAIWLLGAALVGAVVIFALVRWSQKRVKSAIK